MLIISKCPTTQICASARQRDNINNDNKCLSVPLFDERKALNLKPTKAQSVRAEAKGVN